jgi:hypothetical protein
MQSSGSSLPDVEHIRQIKLESMDLTRYGVRPVFLTKKSHLWSADGKPELCLTPDEALAAVGLCAVWSGWPVDSCLSIEPLEE